MNIELTKDSSKPLTVLITYPEKNASLDRLIQAINKADSSLLAFNQDQDIRLSIYDIYYIETLERKTFLYTKDQVFRQKERLLELTRKLTPFGFIQISKSCLLNMEVLDRVRPLWNSRLEATLINGEKLEISRTYVPQIKNWLEKEGTL